MSCEIIMSYSNHINIATRNLTKSDNIVNKPTKTTTSTSTSIKSRMFHTSRPQPPKTARSTEEYSITRADRRWIKKIVYVSIQVKRGGVKGTDRVGSSTSTSTGGRPLTEDMKSCPRSGGHYYSLYLFPPYVVLDPPSGPETTYAYVCVCGCVAGRHTFF